MGLVVFLDSLLIWRIHGSVLAAGLFGFGGVDLNATGPVVFLDSWQLADEGMFGFGVNLNMILE